MKAPKAILFDWDNTLVDTWPAIHQAINATLTAFGLAPWSFDETRGRVRRSMRESFPELFGERWEEAAEFFYGRFESTHLEKLEPLPGAAAMLEELQAAGIYLGVVSNKKGDYLRREVSHLGWGSHFGRIVGALDAARDKPAVESVHMALEGAGMACDSGAVWLAGDTDIDLECAHNAGCVPVLIRETASQPGEFARYPPALHAESCQALCKLVRRL